MNIISAIDLGSKTFWSGLGLIAFGIFNIVQGDVENGIRSIAEGFGFIGLRHAIAKA